MLKRKLNADDSKTEKSDLPEMFNLTAPLYVTDDITAQEILKRSALRLGRSDRFEPVFQEKVKTPSAPFPPMSDRLFLTDKSELRRSVPLYPVQSVKDIKELEHKKSWEKVPLCLIRGLPSVLGIDLSLFDSFTIFQNASGQFVETRKQYRMPFDVNRDHLGQPTWRGLSLEGSKTIDSLVEYQEQQSKLALKETVELQNGSATSNQNMEPRLIECNLRNKKKLEEIHFGTNIDLWNRFVWANQLDELLKLPSFLRFSDDSNMLTYLKHEVLGMNTVQLYMKVDGSRAFAGQNYNNFASVNVNFGPDECRWFGCPYEYWGVVDKLCRKYDINFMEGCIWPDMKELLANNVPVYEFTQKAGDVVYTSPGFIHWSQATGSCNNVTWNVGPFNNAQWTLALERYVWNKQRNHKSLVPMENLAWRLAKDVTFTNCSLYNSVRNTLIRSLSFTKIVENYALANGKRLIFQERDETDSTPCCKSCNAEVFNILFIDGKNPDQDFFVSCVYCARKDGIEKFRVMKQYTEKNLIEIFDGMKLEIQPRNGTASNNSKQ